ncbi:unnamed protein product [Caenorhabditis bovis]|uniref:J domain-containing protein n=1 Tax=Caenorhabditis bovis TaxID=2654633 RepID=A0A8S1EUP6_9PELO|nr:unnamed protein product [Caenorhabditis bovis]
MQQAASGLPSHQFSALLPVAFANLASQPDPSSPLHVLCLQHVVFFVFHQFPANFTNGLELALEGCNINTTPVALLNAFVEKLGAESFSTGVSPNDLGATKAHECAQILAKRLDEARTKLPNMYNIWSRYIDSVTRLAQLFLYIPVRDGFQPNLPATVLQRDLYEVFSRIVDVFHPLIAPYSALQAPFTQSHEKQAMLVLDRFIELLNSLHHNSIIPPGMQNVQALVWQYYITKLSYLSHGSQHYYDVLESQLIRLNWQSLWPSKIAITAMEECLKSRSPYCSSFVAQVFVRIPWNTIFNQISDVERPGYMMTMFGVLTRLVARPKNYEKVRASILEVAKTVSTRADWSNVDLRDVEWLSEIVKTSLPTESLSNPLDVVSVIQSIWRKICGFIPREPFNDELIKKQTIWIKTECELLLRCENTAALAAYNSLISDVSSVASNQEQLKPFCVVACELTALWKKISDPHLGEAFVQLWNNYLMTNPNSPLVLTCLNTIIESLNDDQLTTALKVVEKTIAAYFLRSESCWNELLNWVRLPEKKMKAIEGYLFTIPTSENKVTSLPLTLRVFMSYGNVDNNLFFALHGYITNLKPKHVLDEAGLVCLIAKLVEWMSLRAASLPNQISPTDDLFPPLIRWLNKSSKDESKFFTNLISNKKTTHSPKLRVIFQILELYLTQQSVGEGRRPRCDSNSPVFNSRISAIKEMAGLKVNQHMSATFNKATTYFVNVETYNILSSSKMLLDGFNRCSEPTPGMRIFWLVVISAICLTSIAQEDEDPYSVLGISRRASQREVKGAYKAMAKEWHPDKNQSPEAHEMFMKITKAYDILSDPLKRERYDKFGTIDDTPNTNRGGYGNGRGYDQFFGFGFGGFEDGFFALHRISLRIFTHSILEKSDEKPFIIYAYSNYCQLCFRLQAVWKAAVQDLEPLGYGIATANAMTDGNLVEKLRISQLPAIVAVIEGRVIPMRHNMLHLSDRAIRVFAQKVIPDYFMTRIASMSALTRFVEQWKTTNKVSVIIFGAAAEPRTRYLLSAMKFSQFAKFAYVSLANPSEDNDAIARLSISKANQLKKEVLEEFIEKHKLLTLPRISSITMFDTICPVSSRSSRQLCVLLPVTSSEDTHVEAFREYVKEVGKKWALKNVHFSYIYIDRQIEFVKPFIEKRTGDISKTSRDILVIWRMEYIKVKFTWLEGAWTGRKYDIEEQILAVVEMRKKLEENCRLGSLKNEYSLSFFTRWSRAFWRTFETAWFYLTHEEAYMILSVVGTLFLILGIGWVLSYMSEPKQKVRQRKYKPNDVADVTTDSEWHPDDPKIKKDLEATTAKRENIRAQRILNVMSPLMHELRAETYFGMIRLLKPGCRSIVLLVDDENKPTLLKQFAQYIYPIRNNKTFSFGYLVVPKNLEWFRKLLEHTLPTEDGPIKPGAEATLYQRLKLINPRQCVGTVLSLCGWKLYFSIYHPKHVEASRRNFIDTDEDITSDEEDADSYRNDEFASMGEKKKLHRSLSQKRVNMGNVLDGFPNWLDRLLEGSIRRYYIPEWPDNLK